MGSIKSTAVSIWPSIARKYLISERKSNEKKIGTKTINVLNYSNCIVLLLFFFLFIQSRQFTSRFDFDEVKAVGRILIDML